MSVLLRYPATVPARFSRALDPEPPPAPPPRGWFRFAGGMALLWGGLALIEVPLVKAAAAAVGLALPQ